VKIVEVQPAQNAIYFKARTLSLRVRIVNNNFPKDLGSILVIKDFA
jgi:hypothetical protein